MSLGSFRPQITLATKPIIQGSAGSWNLIIKKSLKVNKEKEEEEKEAAVPILCSHNYQCKYIYIHIQKNYFNIREKDGATKMKVQEN